VTLYLNQHRFFLENAELAPEKDESTETNLAPEWSHPPLKVDFTLERLLGEVESLVQSEWEVMTQVFPNCIHVMQTFVQRIFALTLHNYLEQLVARAQGLSVMRQLRVLASTHRAISSTVNLLKKFDEDVIQKSEAANSDYAPVSASATVSIALDRCLEDLFAPYTEKEKYFDQEKKALEQAFADILWKYHNFLVGLVFGLMWGRKCDVPSRKRRARCWAD
jgi:hypothetical protein